MFKLMNFIFLAAALLIPHAVLAADYMEQGERIKGRSYSPAVITEGGRVIWLAGETATTDLDGKHIEGDFEAQVRTVFALIDQTLHRAGGSVKDIVTMTAYVTDVRNQATFSKVRKEIFADGRYPASAQITISALALPGAQIEVQAVAVIGDKCKEKSCLAH